MTTNPDRPFADIPAALVDEVLKRAEGLSHELLADFEHMRSRRQEWRAQLSSHGLLRRETDVPYVPIPTTCGVDGAYAVERMLTTDMVVAAAVAVEGLTPPSETRYWPEPRHLALLETEPHEAETGTILRALMMGMELELAVNAPHELIFLDGSLTTPLIYFNQALTRAYEIPNLELKDRLLQKTKQQLEAYYAILSSTRTDRCWVGVPKYTTRREIGETLGWPKTYDDRGILSFLLEPGEFTQPRKLKEPPEPWHLNVEAVPSDIRDAAARLSERILHMLEDVRVIYYRPYPWLPALRVEMGRGAADNPARLATVLHGTKHQCGIPGVMEPYPLYMADRMVKHLPKAIPTFRQVSTQYIAEAYQGDISEIFLGLHGYRTESGT